jgi:hypothetical protein
LLVTSLAFGQESCPELWTACGEGTIWDEESQKCIVANVSDTDFDECVGTSDFLIHLANFGSGCSPESLWDCGDSLAYQGYLYETVLIGEQCWFAENLRSENYENGDAIPSGLSDSEWANTSSGAVAVYGEGNSTCDDTSPDGDGCDEAWSLSEYGRLYNWYAVDDARGLCPSGWQVPTDGEWTVLTDHLGGFNSAGDKGYWWSSSPIGASAWYRLLSNYFENVYSSGSGPYYGFSVRCVRDAE